MLRHQLSAMTKGTTQAFPILPGDEKINLLETYLYI